MRERFTDDVTGSIAGNEVTRHATVHEPSSLVEQDDGSRVLKSTTGLTTS